MKKMGKLFFTLILFILLIGNVKAEVYFNVTKAANGTGAKCPKNSLYLRLVGSDSSTKQTINFYNVYESPTSRIAYGQTFCMAPGKESYRNNGEHYCERVITPQKAGANQAFDVAATYAYQTMVNEGIIGANPTIRSRVVGTMTFRWLEYYFGKLDMYGTTSQVTPYIFRSNLDNRTNAVYWNQSNSYVKKAIEISSAAKQLGVRILNGKTTYEKLVAKGKIWTDEWNFVLVNTKQEGDYVTIKFDVTPKAGKAPKSVRWKQFDITCEYGYTCEVVM